MKNTSYRIVGRLETPLPVRRYEIPWQPYALSAIRNNLRLNLRALLGRLLLGDENRQ
jgi:hypothetical protein